ncbi:MAG: homogentisate 1,2-dioxygenase [Bdellovibrionota bacterium]
MRHELKYLSGFGNHFSTEAIPGALPQGQNSPQKVPFGLYAEQLSGTAFTVARHENQRSWLYRIRPSVVHTQFKLQRQGLFGPVNEATPVTPNQLRWDPLPYPEKPTDFIDGLITVAESGACEQQSGAAVHLYAATQSMEDRYFYNADGELMIVPQEGGLVLRTEFGLLELKPGEIAVVQRGMKFQVALAEQKARGFVCENYGSLFRLPQLGPIGANGLANTRDFLAPTAWYEEKSGKFEVVSKFCGNLWSATLEHSPLDVMAWHGNYAPYKYDLSLFQTINTVSFDHPDPSIFTVLTSPSELPGVGNLDVTIFPPRWMVAEHTFRPPYFHRNCMSEYLALIYGVYDGKTKGGFVPGGASLHNRMSAHGPDTAAYEKATSTELKPEYIKGTMAILFESRLAFRPSAWALKTELLQKDYQQAWKGLTSHFKRP